MEISSTKLGDLGTMSGIGAQFASGAAELVPGKVLLDRYEIVKVVGAD